MRLNFKIIALFSVIVLMTAYAGDEVGNGGNSVVCKDRVELLDLYEAKLLRGTKVDLDALSGSSPFEVVEKRLQLLAAVDPKSTKIYLAEVKFLSKEMSFEESVAIKPIADSLHSVEPKEAGCKITQLAVFRKKPLPGEKIVLVDKSIWKRMSVSHQAGLVLHEAIYKRLSELGETDSTKARYLVAYLLSPEFSKPDIEGYWALIKKLRLPIYR